MAVDASDITELSPSINPNAKCIGVNHSLDLIVNLSQKRGYRTIVMKLTEVVREAIFVGKMTFLIEDQINFILWSEHPETEDLEALDLLLDGLSVGSVKYIPH
ncbi:hypothetical protein DO97_12135 [Neosynechococcus sphagnicola sy1]|uniref:Uncharacterized protein n=1 Tax=Neosynechococcus sphagnicola sy1 TaxID=1497020 RepID=A0A098TJ56_9CYAN|nr:hypothetical protein [Neosynechococcus sphagnicola]KGF72094.1 hypothetical protein DO97_12135 [Neosynechococcus sphagnicola sy1]